MPYRGDLEVGLLIRTNCPKAIKPRQVIPGADNNPHGIKTDLGWGIVGRVYKSPDHKEEPCGSWANKIITREEATFTAEHRAKEIISAACVRQMFERDFMKQQVKEILQRCQLKIINSWTSWVQEYTKRVMGTMRCHYHCAMKTWSCQIIDHKP